MVLQYIAATTSNVELDSLVEGDNAVLPLGGEQAKERVSEIRLRFGYIAHASPTGTAFVLT